MRRTVPSVEKTPESRAKIAERINRARLAAGYENAAEFARHVGVQPNTVYRWERAELVPSIFQLESVSRVARVPADWLLRGETVPSDVLARWLTTPRGQTAGEAAAAWLRRLDLMGYVPSFEFYNLALVAYESGLAPEDAVLAAQFSEAKKSKNNGG